VLDTAGDDSPVTELVALGDRDIEVVVVGGGPPYLGQIPLTRLIIAAVGFTGISRVRSTAAIATNPARNRLVSPGSGGVVDDVDDCMGTPSFGVRAE